MTTYETKSTRELLEIGLAIREGRAYGIEADIGDVVETLRGRDTQSAREAIAILGYSDSESLTRPDAV